MNAGPPADPHDGCLILRAGRTDRQAKGGLVLLHGRGGTAEDIARLAPALGAEDFAIAAPQAADRSWWPVSFLAPMDALEPWLSSALAATGRAVAALEQRGLARRDIAIAGFSQGACLALEYAARSGGPFRAVLGLSGGLVGTSDAADRGEAAVRGHGGKDFDYGPARLDGVSVYLGCHSFDPHIPAERVKTSAAVLRRRGAEVAMRLHPGAGHGLHPADLTAARAALAAG